MTSKITTFDLIDNEIKLNIDSIEQFCNYYNGYVKTYKNVKVMTLIGNAATGKSTTLNSIISYKMQQNLAEFKSENLSDQVKRTVVNGIKSGCTKGLDVYCMHKDDNLFMLIDVQGINSHESQADPLVLLFCYYISDLFIVNVPQLDNSAFNLIDDITRYGDYYMKASYVNKPTILFRLYDAPYESNNSILANHYRTMMNNKNDSVNITRSYVEKCFNRAEPPFVWTGYPGDENLKNLHKDNDLLKFINKTNNFPNTCSIIWDILFKLPIGNRNITSYMSEVSVEINKTFSKMKPIMFDDSKINNWLNNVLSYSGEYYSLTIHHTVMDCSDDSYGALNAYKFKIDKFKAEYVTLFGINAPDPCANILELYNQTVEVFNSHKSLILNSIQTNLKTSDIISIANNSWMELSVFDQNIDDIIKTLKLAHNVVVEIKQELYTQYRLIEAKFNKYRDDFNKTILTKLNNSKKILIECKSNYTSFFADYISNLELTFEDVLDLFMANVRSTSNIVHGDEDMLVDIICFIKIYDNNDKLVDIEESPLISQEYIKINEFCKYNINLTELTNDVKVAVNNYKSKFMATRKKLIPAILTGINTQSYEYLCEYYEKIKHNDLYMINFAFDSIAYDLFRSDLSNNMIYTAEQFSKKFSDNVVKFYKVYQNACIIKQNYIKSQIFNMINNDTILSDFKSIKKY